MKKRINITIDDGITEAQAIRMIAEVIGMGRVSCTRRVKHYCHVTQNRATGLTVWAGITRTKQDSFHVSNPRHEVLMAKATDNPSEHF